MVLLRIAMCAISKEGPMMLVPSTAVAALPAGRADYFGEMPNLAARVAGLAHAGQILVEGTSGFTTRGAGTPEKGSSVGSGVGSGVGAALSGLADRSYKRDDMVTILLFR